MESEEILNVIERIGPHLVWLASKLPLFSKSYVDVVTAANECLDKFKIQGNELKRNKRESKEKLNLAKKSADTFVNNAIDFFEAAELDSNQQGIINDSYNEGNYNELCEYISGLQKLFKVAQESHAIFLEKLNEANLSFYGLIERCDDGDVYAKRMNMNTKIFGGGILTATGGALVTATFAAAVTITATVTGTITFGTGALAALAASIFFTGIAGCIMTGAAGIHTFVTVYNLNDCQKVFKFLSMEFENIAAELSDLKQQINIIWENLENANKKITTSHNPSGGKLHCSRLPNALKVIQRAVKKGKESIGTVDHRKKNI